MSISRPFVERPIGTTLLAIGLVLVGAVAYRLLPVASLPAVEFATINIFATQPGADPQTMAATVAAPLERKLGEIAGVNEITSFSTLGYSRISVQFDLGRSVDKAAGDVQAAINAAAADLPADLPNLPRYRKSNPAAAPVLILALTSDSIATPDIYDTADTVVAQRISRIEGVADVTVAGAEQPAIRVKLDPSRLAAMNLGLDQVRAAIVAADAVGPLGGIDGDLRFVAVESNGQLREPSEYADIVVRSAGGAVVRLGDIAAIDRATRNARSSAMFNAKPAILIFITKSADANVIETVDAVKAEIPEIRRWIPEGVEISVLSDRTGTIRASVADMQATLGLSVLLVVAVVFVFLRRPAPTLAAGITVPLSLAGTTACMWAFGFSINNLTLMALVVSVGFVVDDAIVMIENVFRNLEDGLPPRRAALEGARQIGFTVVSIGLSLVAAFIPLLFMGDITGRLLREFSVTLVFAVAVSTVVSLTVTPMICAHLVTAPPSRDRTRFDRLAQAATRWTTAAYCRSLASVVGHRFGMLLVMAAVVAATVTLYVRMPKGFFPQDDTGLVFGSTRAAPDVSYEAMTALQGRLLDIVLADPAVAGVGSSVGSTGFNPSVNQGRIFLSLKPLAERGGVSTNRVIARIRRAAAQIRGIDLYMVAAQDLRYGGRQSRAAYQATFWSPDVDVLYAWTPKIVDRLAAVPGLVDVNSDREQGGLQAGTSIDRLAAARLGVRVQDVTAALNDAFAQRQIATVYGQRNQYRVILEVDPRFQRDPDDIARIHVPGRGGVQVPLSSLLKVERTVSPLVVNHQGPYPSVTISYSLEPDVTLADAAAAVADAIAEMRLPDTIRSEATGDAKAFAGAAWAQPLLILTALVAVYVVLGVLYESLVHPLTILSTLPSAGLGALVALSLADMELSLIALIGIILLIGIVKKNGIMLVDFALEAERRGLPPETAIAEAARERFRPIMMTTFATLLGAVPLLIAEGPGTEIRRPLGVAIVGGLVVSQVLTLYTTPAIYLALDRLRRRPRLGRAPMPPSGLR